MDGISQYKGNMTISQVANKAAAVATNMNEAFFTSYREEAKLRTNTANVTKLQMELHAIQYLYKYTTYVNLFVVLMCCILATLFGCFGRFENHLSVSMFFIFIMLLYLFACLYPRGVEFNHLNSIINIQQFILDHIDWSGEQLAQELSRVPLPKWNTLEMDKFVFTPPILRPCNSV